jgi:hypothetical protein
MISFSDAACPVEGARLLQVPFSRSRVALPSRFDRIDRASEAADCPIGRRQVSERLDFEIVCPNDHDQTVTFSREEFEAQLKSGALVFHCNTCDTNWPPTREEITKIRKELSKNSD